MVLHPLSSDYPRPERFTYPFCYEPHPLCLLAVEEVKQEIERIQPKEGKMFGVLVVEGMTQGDGSPVSFLAAYSGLLEGRNDWDFFVPPVYDAQQPDGYFKQKEREIMASVDHKEMSQALQLWLFRQYKMLNARGEEKDLVEIWQDYHSSPRIREKYPLPPGGTGDCCAPKLLQYAYQHDLKPVCMAEFWWGPSPKSEVRHHGQFYPACSGKCKPVLAWMLQGLDVDPNPEVQGLRHQEPRIVWEDEVMAVVDKPSGMLSLPGKIGDDSVATWALKRWPGAMLVHRLDMMTSGILLVAKTSDAYHHLQKQFEERTIKKKYLAVVEGVPQQEHGIIDLPLSSDPLNRPYQMVDYAHGKRAITEYRALTRVTKEPSRCYTLLALWPHTGRTHQLRMHCAHEQGLGCPIMGDELYGTKADRLYLQAQAISFVHPASGRKLHFELPAAFDLEHLNPCRPLFNNSYNSQNL
ncbi:MAG: RluA family pseudouridine synthase [Bacteroidaceae bacterium]|nr:RluA family pseudouridine synthase [Bacteroidaceae bacterium]